MINTKKVRTPVNSISGNGSNVKFSWSNARWGKVWSIYNIEYVDYMDFPAINYFVNKNGVYPSTIKYDAAYNYNDFISLIDSLPKSFYTESLSQINDASKWSKEIDINTYKSFICFEDKKTKILFYITCGHTPSSLEQLEFIKNNNAKLFTIVCLYSPKLSSNDVLQKIQKIISTPSLDLNIKSKGINFISSNQNGYFLEKINIPVPDIDFNLCYTTDFIEKHAYITSELKKDVSGLFLFHGAPGTGKTNYIRHIINMLSDKTIYLPTSMIGVLSKPDFLSFMLNHKNSVLVIEDAEECLKDSADRSSAVTNLLNLTDGLLGDALNIKVVATFNIPISKIDKALLREGRLTLKHEFGPITANQATMLSAKLGINKKYQEPVCLAQVYNEEKQYKETKLEAKIGFNSIKNNP